MLAAPSLSEDVNPRLTEECKKVGIWKAVHPDVLSVKASIDTIKASRPFIDGSDAKPERNQVFFKLTNWVSFVS